MNTGQDDRIFRSTRVVAVLVVPFLVLAFLILFFMPETSGTRFAWEIKPSMTAAFMGAGYLGGSWLFLNVIWGKRWHRVAPGFPAVTAFTVAMLLVTALHWERFDLSHRPFQIWLVLYVVTPFLVPFLWWRNRVTDPHTPEPDDVVVPPAARWGLGLLGALLLGFAVFAFVRPESMAALWPWQLSPLTARIMGGWFALLGVGGIVIARENALERLARRPAGDRHLAGAGAAGRAVEPGRFSRRAGELVSAQRGRGAAGHGRAVRADGEGKAGTNGRG